jgi:hypothetical protein
MARTLGAKGKRTRMREARIAAAKLHSGADQYATADCLDIMEDAMRYFYRKATHAKADAKIREHFLAAVSVAAQVAPYRWPKLSTVKVAGDSKNPLLIRDGVTAEEVRQELMAEIMESGILPTQLKQLEAPVVDGVANRNPKKMN